MSAGEPRRVRLMGLAVLIAFVLTLGFSLALLLPSAQELEDLSTATAPSELSIQHLRALAAANPDDQHLRLLLARDLFITGDLDASDTNVQLALSAAGEVGVGARKVALALALTRFRAHTNGVDEAAVERALRAVLADRLDLAALESAAKTALEIGRPGLAAETYERLAQDEMSRRAEWLAEAARWHRAAGHEGRAAELYAEAAAITSDREKKLSLAKLAIDSAAAAANVQLAHGLSERFLRELPGEPELMTRALAYATATGQGARARQIGRELVDVPDQNDPAVIEAQVDRELAAGDFGAAIFLLNRILGLQPNNAAIHARIAQIADAAGDSRLAYGQYRWLAEHGAESQFIDRAITLARATYDSAGALELLVRRARQPNATDAQILELVQGYEDIGDPDAAARVLRDRLAERSGSRVLWKRLAVLEESRGAPVEAVKAWRAVARIAPLDGEEALRDANLLWRLDDPRGALGVLTSVPEGARGRGIAYWSLLADLAWELNDHDQAIRALRQLRAQGDTSLGIFERLIAIEQNGGNEAEAARYAVEAYKLTSDPRMLFLAVDLLEKRGKDREIVALLLDSGTKNARLLKLEEYWTRRAAALQRLGQLDEACVAYDEALRLQPASAAYFSAALACAVERDDRPGIERHVARWRGKIDGTPDLYLTYALALVRLHRDREAIVYILRHLKTTPSDYMALLELADAAERLGDHSHAYRVRRHALLKVWPHALAALKAPKDDAKSRRAILARAILARKLEGPEASYRWLERLVPPGEGKIVDAQAADLAVSYYLADGNSEMAKRILLKSRALRTAGDRNDRNARLTIALLDNNIADIERLLAPVSGAPASYDSTQIEGLIRTGHDAEAMNAIDAAIASSSVDVDRNTIRDLRSERADAAERIAPTGRAGYALDSYGPLLIHGPRAAGSLYLSKVRVEAEFQRNEISANAPALPLGSFAEYQASAISRYRTLRTNTSLTLGANVRNGAVSPQVSVAHAHQLFDRLSGRVGVALQDVPSDTPLVRAAGVRDSASAELGVAITQRDRIELAGTVFQERTIRRDALSHGAMTTLTASHAILHASPEWSVLASGMLIGRSLSAGAGGALEKLGIAADATPSDLLPTLAYMATVGTRVENGDPTSPWGRVSFPRYSVALSAGRLWPAAEWSLEARAGGGTRVFGDDVLGLSGYYARGLAGSGDTPFTGASVYYAHGI